MFIFVGLPNLKKMQHITREQRYAISAYRQTGWTQTRIAKELGLSQAGRLLLFPV
jgi:IS30 family transposase